MTNIRKSLIEYLITKYKGICQNCGITTNSRDFKPIKKSYLYRSNGARSLGLTFPTVEHIIPRHKGGQRTRFNCTLFCWKCNNNGSKRYSREMNSQRQK